MTVYVRIGSTLHACPRPARKPFGGALNKLRTDVALRDARAVHDGWRGDLLWMTRVVPSTEVGRAWRNSRIRVNIRA